MRGGGLRRDRRGVALARRQVRKMSSWPRSYGN
jgi:hypothetical protein